jgi:hypothetical protein
MVDILTFYGLGYPRISFSLLFLCAVKSEGNLFNLIFIIFLASFIDSGEGEVMISYILHLGQTMD